MVVCYLRIPFISVLILFCTAQPNFNCPKTVAVGDSAKLTCSNLINSVIITNPAGVTVGNCVGRTTCVIPDGIEGINITFMDNNTILLTVQDITMEDEGMWTCDSGSKAECSLNVYKLPSCKISSTSSTNDLSLGQYLTLNINLTDYYCTNSIVWNLTIRDQSHNVTGFRDREETDDIRSRIVTYSSTVTPSLTGRVDLTFNCNNETYDVSCSLVEELQLRELPSCEISSTSSTNELSLGQDLPLNINLTDYYCTNSIVWDLTIGGQSQNVTGFRDREETDDISSRIVTYSTTVTSSFTERVELTFNCNDETYGVSCSGVKELELRDPPSCKLTSDDDTDDLTVGNNLTLKADIEKYPCTSDIKYALLSGFVMITEFPINGTIFHATFKVKPEYLDKQLHLKYTCNNVSATTRTEGVTILRIKNDVQSPALLTETEWIIIIAVIALVVIVGVIITVIVICRFKRKKKSLNNDPQYSDVIDTLPGRKNSLKVTSNNLYTKVSDVNGSLKKHHFEASDVNDNPKGGLSETGDVKGSQKKLRDEAGRDGDLNDKSRKRSVCEMVPNTAYESVDDIRLELKEKQKGNNLKCPEGIYAKVDKQRSQKNGVPDLVASAKM